MSYLTVHDFCINTLHILVRCLIVTECSETICSNTVYFCRSADELVLPVTASLIAKMYVCVHMCTHLRVYVTIFLLVPECLFLFLFYTQGGNVLICKGRWSIHLSLQSRPIIKLTPFLLMISYDTLDSIPPPFFLLIS